MSNQTIIPLSTNSLVFPSVELALTDPNGLLAFNGDLSPDRLLSAYKNGIFPWYNEDDPILWWSPNPRGVLFTNKLKINKTLRKFLRKKPYQITVNNCFNDVISLCADAPFRKEGTWINHEMLQAYQALHQYGYCHSIEVWHNKVLVGGLYGVAINGLFCGESMFYCKENASKIALLTLVNLLKSENITIIDCQMQNDFLASMGTEEISRSTFIQFKDEMLAKKLSNDFWQPRDITQYLY